MGDRLLKKPSRNIKDNTGSSHYFLIRIKRAPRNRGALLRLRLVAHCDVGRLGSLGTLFDNELDLLTFSQVAEAGTLNGGEMDENARTAGV